MIVKSRSALALLSHSLAALAFTGCREESNADSGNSIRMASEVGAR